MGRRRRGGRLTAGWALAVLSASVALVAGCGEDGPGAEARSVGEGRDTAAHVRSADTALLRLGRELLPEAARISGFEPLGPVHLARRSREELGRYLEGQLDEQLPEGRAERLAAAYRRLGLLPDTLELRPFLRRLYLEQVAGYYDPAADTLFVMEGAEGEQLRTVLVHEVTHALQDQRVDMDSIVEALDGQNDRSTAFQAAVEGQAMFVMTEWRVGQLTGESVDLTRMPGLMEKIRESAASGGGAMPVFGSAPRILRETLTFPYIEGMGLIVHLWSGGSGRPAPFGELLPLSTEQVLHPEKLAGRDADPPRRLSVDGLPGGWEERYGDSLGELEAGIFLGEHLGDGSRGRRLAAGWDGDLVLLARDGGEGEALAWFSVWDSAADADSAAAGLEAAMEGRYGGGDGADRRVRIARRPLAGRPGVVLLDLPAGAAPEPWIALSREVRLSELRR